jgi:hypothetical protein
MRRNVCDCQQWESLFHADHEHGVPSAWNRSLHGAGAVASSAESAAESIGDLDPNSVRVHDVGRPAAWPVNDRVIEPEPKPKIVNATDRLIDVVNDKSDMVDVDILKLEISRGRNLNETQVEAVGGSEDAPSTAAAAALLLEFYAQKGGIEARGFVEIAYRDLDMINASRIDGGGWAQPNARFANLEVDGGRLGSRRYINGVTCIGHRFLLLTRPQNNVRRFFPPEFSPWQDQDHQKVPAHDRRFEAASLPAMIGGRAAAAKGSACWRGDQAIP